LNDVREFKFLTGLDITGMGPEEVNQSIRSSLNKLSPKKTRPIVILQINGIIDSETEGGIERVEILKYGDETLKPLFFHIEPNWECLGPRPVDLTEPLNIEKSVREYIQFTGQSGHEDLVAKLRDILEAK
jgi:hypothetical protein